MHGLSHKNKMSFKKNSNRSVKFNRYVVLQVNDAAVRIRLVVFVSKVQTFYTQIIEKTGGGKGREEKNTNPSDLLCWLTAI